MIRADVRGLGHYLQRFFGDYLTHQRKLSPNTILNYRDAIKLLLLFAAEHHGKGVSDLEFADVDVNTILAFLTHLETHRRCSVRTRNTRLAALHTFFRYLAAHEPRLLHLCQQVAMIPVKRAQPSPPTYLEYDEVRHILKAIDVSTRLGRRDRLLVHLLFETGARAHELATLRTSDLHLTAPYQVRILGKGERNESARCGRAQPEWSVATSTSGVCGTATMLLCWRG